MPTPDRFKGRRDEEGILFSSTSAPTEEGEVRFVTGLGFRFFENGVERGLDLPVGAGDVSYDNAVSGLVATNVQDAIDEVEGRVDLIEASVSQQEIKYRMLVWAEENGALDNGQREWSFGNGSTGNIGITIWEDCDVVGMIISTENTAGVATVSFELDGVAQQSITTDVGVTDTLTFFPAATAATAGQRIGFITNTDTGRSDARVGAILEFSIDISGFQGPPGMGTDELVKASATDTTAGFLTDKLVSTGRIVFTTLNPGANEQIQISVTDPPASDVTYSNVTSGLVATDVQAAIDEVEGRVDALEAGGGVDELVGVTTNDTTPGFLNDKIVAGVNITTAILNPGANEQLQINVDTIGADEVTYDNAVSGLLATNVKDAIDENDARLDVLEASGFLTEANHETLDTLAHDIVETSFESVTYTGRLVTNVTVFTDATLTTKIRETQVTYTGRLATQVVTIQYDASGVEIYRLTENVTYAGRLVQSIDRVRS